jgi:hypothetical protein
LFWSGRAADCGRNGKQLASGGHSPFPL